MDLSTSDGKLVGEGVISHEREPAVPSRGALATVVRAVIGFLAVGLVGVVLMLGGLVWDSVNHARDAGDEHVERSLFDLSNPSHAVMLLGGALVVCGLTGATVRALSLSGGSRLSSPRTGTALVVGSIVAVAATGGAVRWASTAQPPIATGPLAPAPGADHHRIGIVNSHADGPCRPTKTQKAAAAKLVDDTALATAKYKSFPAALADGYVGRTGSPYTEHFVNAGHMQDGKVLDPSRPEALMYTPSAGGPVLVGVMYVMNAPGEFGPEPGGCLTRWHVHTNVCLNVATQGLFELPETETACPAGTIKYVPPPLLHVWLLDVPGGRFAAEVSNEDLFKRIRS